MNRIIFGLTIILTLMVVITGTAYAKSVLFSFTIDEFNDVDIEEISVVEADVLLPENDGDYELRILDSEENEIFSHDFNAYFDESNTDYYTFFRLPMYKSHAEYRIVYKNEEIQSVRLNTYLCNENDICESDDGETYILCSDECPEPVQSGGSGFEILYLLIPIIAVVIIIIFIIMKKRSSGGNAQMNTPMQ